MEACALERELQGEEWPANRGRRAASGRMHLRSATDLQDRPPIPEQLGNAHLTRPGEVVFDFAEYYWRFIPAFA
ncbi:hypothetical protein SKAU_G00353380 [Synaphobranchus kaupii]|uniref:Uncharacterized protein n=1 Tax=Synaphobranchus kaupii TaxID=118154 RepID=A0A9Q1EL43_SYNKA|nr:hypothetical protein SKAU_G00353380 [Synaphobranchus kaupii]